MLISSALCELVLGDPTKLANERKYMVLYDVPTELEIGVIPKRIYCNKAMVPHLDKAFRALIQSGAVKELKTWDGCFNVRKKRGSNSMSLHSWGLAIDINAAWNRFGAKPKMSQSVVRCFTENGFDWGGTWTKPDGMHFQLKKELLR